MWNKSRPAQLLYELRNLSGERYLVQAQQIIDADKYTGSCEEGRDLCGEYAQFCNYCDKSLGMPCASAYYNMLNSEKHRNAPQARGGGEGRIRIATAKKK